LTDDDDIVAAAELIVGELLSNAARHADGHVCLEISAVDGFVTLSVHDTSPLFAMEIRRPIDEMSESGRGLFIVSKLAERIDVTPITGVGKCVSVRLSLPVTANDPFKTCSRPWLRGGGLIVLGAIGAYFVLALRLPQHLAFALALFGACIVGLFVFALRLALDGAQRHDHEH
jgi:anti-sigma regulatory factor (Ser/Thr protein kinase)